ncbi:MAG: glycosyl hydrolase 53 family protein [Lachnospiraceae bacterium]|nr:glycosyl hydrolase 53 family protein [Lachnospiraceae bacterium]
MKKKLVSLMMLTGSILMLTACGSVKQKYTPVLPTGAEDASVFVAPVDSIGDDFIRGIDISSVIAEEESGVVYKDEAGNEKDVFEILADAGINYIRVRVWNEPYDENGNGFGGGNCDVEKAGKIGKRAAECGMKLLVDFHYSDFWADPNKQFAPTKWARRDAQEKADLIREFTEESLKSIRKAGADIGMVQIGNEINNGLCGVYDQNTIMELLKSASAGVRAVDKNIKVAVHYTALDDPEGTIRRADLLSTSGVDYDIFGVSYYPYWHGTMENMNSLLKQIKQTYGKDTCILETAYLWTGEDGDVFGNSVAGEDAIEGYPASVQGQAKCIRDIAAYAADAGALGIFYWEGAWVPVGNDYDSNKSKWEQYGSGWASSYSVFYDPRDAGVYYGGCSWDNQAMFDFDGKALPSLNVFKWLKYGAKAPLEVLAYKDVYVESGIGDALVMPDAVSVYYNDPAAQEDLQVTWDTSAVDVNEAGVYEVPGSVANGDSITAKVKIMNINYLENFSFEDADASMWTVNDMGSGDSTDIQTKASDALSGEKAFHFYSTQELNFTIEQTVTKTLSAGTFAAVANFQGGDLGSSPEIVLYVNVGGQTYTSEPATPDGWQHWQRMEIKGIEVADGDSVTVGVSVKGAAKGWGTIDDIEFYSEK